MAKPGYPWYAWLIMALAWAFCTAIFFLVFGNVSGAPWLRWVTGAIPSILVLPFLVKGISQ